MGRSSVAGHRWPHAQIEVTVAKRDLEKKDTLERRLALLDALSSLHHCNFYVHTTTCGGDVLRFTAEDGGGAHSHGEAWKTTIP